MRAQFESEAEELGKEINQEVQREQLLVDNQQEMAAIRGASSSARPRRSGNGKGA
jgi:hypothetical protein